MLGHFLASTHPILESYFQSDWTGKLIFIALILLSVISWTLIVYKQRVLHRIRARANSLRTQFAATYEQPLGLIPLQVTAENPTTAPFDQIYAEFKSQSLARLKKNHHYMQSASGQTNSRIYLSLVDIEYIESSLGNAISLQVHHLERDLMLLSITTALAPFLGLLGTVWGILMTFTQMQAQGGNEAVLAGISMALGTTVVGLIVAIPALIGYHYFKGAIHAIEVQLDDFATQLIAALEMQYRRADIIPEELK